MSVTASVSLVLIVVLVLALGIIRLRQLSLQNLVLGAAGTILGLVVGALASVPLSKLPSPFGALLPVIISLVAVVGGVVAVFYQSRIILHLFPFLSLGLAEQSAQVASGTASPEILVDTSVIIDGRIADIARAGFIPGRLLVPRFVLAELQNIADSDDAMRRGRGRRGLEVLNTLRTTEGIEVEVIDQELPDIKEVDAKLVRLAKLRSTNVLTTDFNLNRVAQIEGVRVLNINELSNAIRPVVLPGEELAVHVVQPGKEKNQGVGYLPDGTMIVVENGDKLIGQEVMTEVTRVFQTVAGKMIFAAPRKAASGKTNYSKTPPTGAPSVEEAVASEAIAAAHIDTKPLLVQPERAGGTHRGRRGHRGSGSQTIEDRLITQNQESDQT